MNKKLITAIAVVMAVCMMFAACTKEEPVHNHTFDSSKWVSDATMHWHAATCEHADERTDIQGHIDENIDGVCDVCAYAASHTHAFEEEWSYDATNHWHASTCFHNVIDGSAAHTPDDMGFCTECGYKVSDPDVDSVKDAVDVGVAQKDTIKHGSITTSDGSTIDFEYRNGYLYVKEGTTEYFYTPTGDDQVLAVVRTNAWGEVTIYRDTLATTDNLEGPSIPAGFINYEFSFYGAEDLVSYLYQLASVDNANGDFAESVADGVYSFSFGYYIEYYGLYVITVEFTLDETTYAIATVDIESKSYSTEQIQVVTEATDELPATYAPIADAEPYTRTLSIKQGIDAENPYKPVDLLATGFDLMDAEGNVLTDSFTVEYKQNSKVYIGNLVPDTAMLEFVMIEISGENVNLSWDDPNYANGLNAFAYDGYISLNTSASVGTTFTLNVSVNGVVKTYTVTVVEPVPTSITAGVLGDNFGSTVVNPSNKLEMEQGESQSIGAYLDKPAGEIKIAVTPETALEEDQYASFSAWDDNVGGYVYGTSYNLSKLPAGEYVFTFTSTVNAELTASITVTVKEKAAPNPGAGSFITPTGSGVQTDPFIITQSGNYKANVVNGADVYFAFTATQSGKIEFKFTSTNGYLTAGLYNFMLCDKSTSSTLSVDINAGQTFYMKVTTYQMGATGEVTFSITVPGSPAAGTTTGTGSQADPFVITTAGDYTAKVVSGANVYYAFTATKDVTITFTFAKSNGYLSYGTFNFGLLTDMTSTSMTIKLKAGQTLYMAVTTYAYGATEDVGFNFKVEG